MTEKKLFVQPLLEWYAENHRPFPWRNTKDPYKIWVSEVILQQTRAQQGLPYYLRFLELFPTLEVLAQSNQEDLLRCWQGLGYYARARNMHYAAKVLLNEHKGLFPTTPEALQNIKGIGPYTAAAIASFAFDYEIAVLDGNVFRLLSRYFGIDKEVNVERHRGIFMRCLKPLIHGEAPALFNQAIMEFGAQQCRPKPKCDLCLLQRTCHAWTHQKVDILPLKLPKKPKRTRYFHYFVFEEEHGLWLHQRQKKDIWQGLYDFYLIEATEPLEWEELCALEPTLPPYKPHRRSSWQHHLLTHQRIVAQFLHISHPLRDIFSFAKKNALFFADYATIDRYPKPILIAKYLRRGHFLSTL